MRNSTIQHIDYTNPNTLDNENLPFLISDQVEKLNQLSENVQLSIEAAKRAEKSALEAKEKSAGFGKKKIAIEELQVVSIELAKAVQNGAEAHKTSFEFQKKLAEITKYLLRLGISSIANNRIVIRELEKRLKGASEEEITELAQQEIIQVLFQLKAQEDTLSKLEHHNQNIKQLKNVLVEQFEYGKELNERIFSQKFILENYEKNIDLQNEFNEFIEAKLIEQNNNIDTIFKENQYQARILELSKSGNMILEDRISELEIQKERLTKTVNDLEEVNKEISNTIAIKANNKFVFSTLLLAIVSIILSILNLFV